MLLHLSVNLNITQNSVIEELFTKCDVVCKIFQHRLGSKLTLTRLVVITVYQLIESDDTFMEQ